MWLDLGTVLFPLLVAAVPGLALVAYTIGARDSLTVPVFTGAIVAEEKRDGREA
jgi:hypothetical protein